MMMQRLRSLDYTDLARGYGGAATPDVTDEPIEWDVTFEYSEGGEAGAKLHFENRNGPHHMVVEMSLSEMREFTRQMDTVTRAVEGDPAVVDSDDG